MQPAPQEVALSDEHIEYLGGIYYKKQRLWMYSMLGISALLLKVYTDKLMLRWDMYEHADRYDLEYLDKMMIVPYVVIVITLLFIICFIQIYRRKIGPLRKDIRQRTGLIIHKQISRKSKIVPTKEYFFFFHDLKMPHKEVTAADYARYDEGDYFPFLVSARSNIQVDGFYNYELF